MTRAAIIGTGDLAYGLAHLFSINNTGSSGHTLEVTKPNLQKEGLFHDTKVNLTDFDDALVRADVLILAIPSWALRDFVIKHEHKLAGKILVDVTNSKRYDDALSTALLRNDTTSTVEDSFHSFMGHMGKLAPGGQGDYDEESTEAASSEEGKKKRGPYWVKAFNDVGAVDILLREPADKKKIKSKMCSNALGALDVVRTFAEDSLGMDVKAIPIEQYEAITDNQQSLGEDWTRASWTIGIVFVITIIYNIARYPMSGGYPWNQFPMFGLNKSVCWTALWGFAICQIPGCIARFYNAWYRDTLRDKPLWLRNSLSFRKHLGLLSLWFLVLHMLMSCLIFGINYYKKFFEDKTDPKSRLNLNGGMLFMFGALSSCLYIVMGLCSLPSVAEGMTKRQWDLIYGPVAWVALALGTAHVMCMGMFGSWKKAPWDHYNMLPPISLTSCLLPWLAIFIKICQMAAVRYLDSSARRKEAGKHWA